MTAKGLSQKQLADKAGVSAHTVFRCVSKGKTPRGKQLDGIAQALGVTVSDLYSDPDAPKPASELTPAEFQKILDARFAKQERMLEELAAVKRPQVHSSGTTAPLTLSPEEKNLIAKLRRAGGDPAVFRNLHHVLDQFLADQVEVTPKKSKRA